MTKRLLDPVEVAIKEKQREDREAKKPRVYCPGPEGGKCGAKIPTHYQKRRIGFCPKHVPWPQDD